MDSTLFDHKNSTSEGSRTIPKNNFKNLRPTSAQISKLSAFPSPHENYQGGGTSQPTSLNRVRPTTSGFQRNLSPPYNEAKNNPGGMIEELDAEEEARLAEKAAFEEPQLISDITKLMPKNIKVEKEKLYEDTLHLKQTINVLKEDNLKLKTKNLNLERENIKLTKALEKVGNPASQYGKPVESALIVALKKQTKEAKEELKVKLDEIEAMKRNMRFTKVQELEIELRAYMDENVRLKNLFEELMRSKPQIKPEDYNMLEERYYIQLNMIETLQRDHARLTAEIKHLEEQNYTLQSSRDQELRNAQKLQGDLTKLKKQLKEKDLKGSPSGKIETTMRQLGVGASLGRPGEKSKGDEGSGDLKKQLEQKEQVLIQRDKSIEDLKQKLNEKLSNEIKEKQNFSNETNKIKEQYALLEAKYKALLSNQFVNEGKIDHEDDDLRPNPVVKNLGLEKGKKVKVVTYDHIENLGYELSLKLKIRRIPLEEVLKSLDRFGPRISVGDMKSILAYDPFGVKDENNALTIARYIVEPDEEEMVTFDIGRTQTIGAIKNNVKKLLGSYTLFTEKEVKKMAAEIGEIVTKYEESLDTQFMMMPEAKTGYLSADQIAKAFEMLDIDIKEQTFEYLIMNLYEYTGNLKRLDYMKMFEIFETEEHKNMKKILEVYQGQDIDPKNRDDVLGTANKIQEKKANKQGEDEEYAEEFDEEYQEEGEEYDEEDYDQEDEENNKK